MLNHSGGLLRLILLLLVSTVAAGDQIPTTGVGVGDATQRPQCPTGQTTGSSLGDWKDWKKVNKGATVLIGADVLGRIAVAADYDGDEFVDEVMLYTATTRLTGPAPVLLKGAKIVQTTPSLTVEAADRSLAVALIVSDEIYEVPSIPKRWRRYSQVVVEEEGIALYRTVLQPVLQRHLSSYDHNSLQTWPENFRDDLLGDNRWR